MNIQWLAMEHYRLHLIEEWPDGLRKEAALAAVRSTIRSLTAQLPHLDPALVCSICGSRPQPGHVVEFPVRPAHPAERAA